MHGSCGFVRPYPGRLGARVMELISDAGYLVGPNAILPAGTSDERAARWIGRNSFELLVIPFHLHRGDGGEVLDGIGVLLQLPESDFLRPVPIVMPVRNFSWHASFLRRFEVLQGERPDLLPWLLTIHQDDFSRNTLAARLRRTQDARPQSPTSISGTFSIPSLGAERAPVPEVLVTASPRVSVRPSSIPPTSKIRTGVESARQSFRRATEIGAQAQKDFEEEKRLRRQRR